MDECDYNDELIHEYWDESSDQGGSHGLVDSYFPEYEPCDVLSSDSEVSESNQQIFLEYEECKSASDSFINRVDQLCLVQLLPTSAASWTANDHTQDITILVDYNGLLLDG